MDDNERVALALVSEEGLTRKDGYRRNGVEVPIAMVVTDRHLVFAAVGGDGTEAGKIAYEELAGVEVEHETLVLTTTDGVNWRFPLGDSESEAVDIAVRHLCWIGDVRNRLVSVENDIELAAGKMQTQGADLNWEGAFETYRDARTKLDDLVCQVQCTTPIRDGVLAPELTDLDRKLESVCARLYIDRCRSQLELSTQLLQYSDYEQARKVFEEAEGYHDSARWHTEEVKRPDAFQFGRQRDLAHNLEELRWEIESTAAEPLQEAKEATVEADSAETLSDEIEHLEVALDRYRGLQRLEWGEYLGDEADAVDEELRETATRLIDTHERAARNRWNDGSRQEAEDDLQAAVRECTVATEHLERAHELAEEFDPPRASGFESRLKQMFEMLLDMQETKNETGQTPDETQAETGDAPAEPDASLSGIPESGRQHDDLPTLEDLSDIDLHHDITLDLEGDADPLDLEDGDSLDTDPLDTDPLDIADSDEPESTTADTESPEKQRQ